MLGPRREGSSVGVTYSPVCVRNHPGADVAPTLCSVRVLGAWREGGFRDKTDEGIGSGVLLLYNGCVWIPFTKGFGGSS